MRKVLSFIGVAMAILLYSCNSEDSVEPIDSNDPNAGKLVATVSFEGIGSSLLRTAESTAIPITSWDNVKSMQLFLYNAADSTVGFSAVITPSQGQNVSGGKSFTWTNVPAGVYNVLLVANIDSNDDNIASSLTGGNSWTRLTPYNVVNKALNREIFLDLKEGDLPSGHNFSPGLKAYNPASEVFMARGSAPVSITEGNSADLGNLMLMREISLMRVRIDRKPKTYAPDLDDVNFNHAKNFIGVQSLPVGLGFTLQAKGGGITKAPSDDNRILIGGVGIDTYRDADPSSGYGSGIILKNDFTLWRDIQVLPNARKSENRPSDADADSTRRYFVIISGVVPKGYKYSDGSEAKENESPVYWAGTVKGVFSPNVIREVNLIITSGGLPDPPTPGKEGELIITVGKPEDWNSQIETEEIEV